ncbi:AAA-type ATPase family protein/ankyrin repeat family protein [Forsythia ovata]|uniref:AAA-type ATPase family protein/ankyrin repeat family protein n=1 Tax=Forsythia ovata TaxID=205694 RepID=A0ABD1SMG1_9LAMI
MRIQDKYSKVSVPNTTIHACAESGDLIGFQRLLQNDPSRLHERSLIMVQTPLHVSVANNKVEIVSYLLDWRGPGEVELEAKNVYGETPLHLAAKNGRDELARMLLSHHANIEAKTNNGLTPLHLTVGYALRSGDYSTVKTLLDNNANCFAEDNEGMVPLNYVPDILGNEELRRLLCQNVEEQRYSNYNEETRSGVQGILDELDRELSKIVGLHDLKVQLRKWAKGMLLDEKRRSMGIDLGPRKAPHMAFLGNPGTGKTTVARILGKLLHSLGVLSSDTVIEVQRTDLVGEYLGQTGPKTRGKIEEAKGGILFVDEAYRLAIVQTTGFLDYGVEALEEIMSVLEDGDIVVIFAGYTEPMKRVMSSNEGFCRRVAHFFHFDDFSSRDLAEIVRVKMTKQTEGSRFYGFKLHPLCTLEAVTALIDREITEKLRNKMNGGLVDHMLTNAKENLDARLSFDSKGDELLTITLNDLEVGLQQLSSRVTID